MATLPADDLKITEGFGPHLSAMTGIRLSTSVEPDRLVKTHCCFCGQQCGIQLKVHENQVIGFEPWEEFPFNRGTLYVALAAWSIAMIGLVRSIVAHRW
jgi:assimilatory nitrate reductase catalytic subunit